MKFFQCLAFGALLSCLVGCVSEEEDKQIDKKIDKKVQDGVQAGMNQLADARIKPLEERANTTATRLTTVESSQTSQAAKIRAMVNEAKTRKTETETSINLLAGRINGVEAAVQQQTGGGYTPPPSTTGGSGAPSGPGTGAPPATASGTAPPRSSAPKGGSRINGISSNWNAVDAARMQKEAELRRERGDYSLQLKWKGPYDPSAPTPPGVVLFWWKGPNRYGHIKKWYVLDPGSGTPSGLPDVDSSPPASSSPGKGGATTEEEETLIIEKEARAPFWATFPIQPWLVG